MAAKIIKYPGLSDYIFSPRRIWISSPRHAMLEFITAPMLRVHNCANERSHVYVPLLSRGSSLPADVDGGVEAVVVFAHLHGRKPTFLEEFLGPFPTPPGTQTPRIRTAVQ